jgi:hypothetical protein
MVGLGETHWDKLDNVISDCNVKSKSLDSRLAETMAKMKAYFLKSWGRLRGRGQCIKRSRTKVGSQTGGTLLEEGLSVKAPFIRRLMKEC